MENKQKRYWFKAKTYGWGWTPATWEGWTVLILWIASAVYLFRDLNLVSGSFSDTLVNFFPRLFFLTGVLFLICAWTGEKPHWSWGNKKEEKV